MLKSMSAQLFWIIAKQKTARFIALTGYGNAAGLLYDTGIFTGQSTMEGVDVSSFSDDENEDEDEQREEKINEIINKRYIQSITPVLTMFKGLIKVSIIILSPAGLRKRLKISEAMHRKSVRYTNQMTAICWLEKKINKL